MTSSFLSNLRWSQRRAGNLCRSDLLFPQLGTSVRCRCLTRRRCPLIPPTLNSRLGVHQLECEIVPPMTSYAGLYDVIRRGGCEIAEKSRISVLARLHSLKKERMKPGSNPRPLGRLKRREISALTNSATTAGTTIKVYEENAMIKTTNFWYIG